MSTSAISPATAPATAPANLTTSRAARSTPTKPVTDSAAPDHKATVSKTTANTPNSAAVAALQEATETSAQTAKEASGGDRQAQRLQQKNAAAHNHTLSHGTVKASQPSSPSVVNSSGQLTGTIVNTKA